MKVKELIDKLLELPAECLEYEAYHAADSTYTHPIVDRIFSHIHEITFNDDEKEVIFKD